MARHDDGNRIRPDRPADRAPRSGPPGRDAEFAVTHNVAPPDVGELRPHGLLEGGAAGGEGQFEGAAVAQEVFAELTGGEFEQRAVDLGQVVVGERSRALDGQRGDGIAIARDFDSPDGRVDALEMLRRFLGV